MLKHPEKTHDFNVNKERDRDNHFVVSKILISQRILNAGTTSIRE